MTAQQSRSIRSHHQRSDLEPPGAIRTLAHTSGPHTQKPGPDKDKRSKGPFQEGQDQWS